MPWADLRSRSKEGRTECIAFSCIWMAERVMRSLQTRDIEVAHLRAGQAMAELEADRTRLNSKARPGGEMPRSSRTCLIWRMLSTSQLPPRDTRASRSETRHRGLLGSRTPMHLLRRSNRQVPVVWNDLIREVERIRRRKNQSPLSFSWHRTWAWPHRLPSSSVLSNCLKPLQKPSGSGSIKCRTQALVV